MSNYTLNESSCNYSHFYYYMIILKNRQKGNNYFINFLLYLLSLPHII